MWQAELSPCVSWEKNPLNPIPWRNPSPGRNCMWQDIGRRNCLQHSQNRGKTTNSKSLFFFFFFFFFFSCWRLTQVRKRPELALGPEVAAALPCSSHPATEFRTDTCRSGTRRVTSTALTQPHRGHSIESAFVALSLRENVNSSALLWQGCHLLRPALRLTMRRGQSLHRQKLRKSYQTVDTFTRLPCRF